MQKVWAWRLRGQLSPVLSTLAGRRARAKASGPHARAQGRRIDGCGSSCGCFASQRYPVGDRIVGNDAEGDGSDRDEAAQRRAADAGADWTPAPSSGPRTTNSSARRRRGDRAAFDSLVRRYDQAVLRLALHMLGNEQDAQDVHQEAFLKAYRHLGNFRFECSFYTWLYRIVTNLCLDQLRRRKSRREDPATVVDAQGDEMDLLSNVCDTRAMANPARELDRKQMGQCIADALDKLTPRERTVFELKHYQGLKLRTIGEMLSTTEETAKNTLFRATRKLRANLAELRESKT